MKSETKIIAVYGRENMPKKKMTQAQKVEAAALAWTEAADKANVAGIAANVAADKATDAANATTAEERFVAVRVAAKAALLMTGAMKEAANAAAKAVQLSSESEDE